MIELKLTKGLVAYIDDEDYRLAQFKWQAFKGKITFYARRRVRNEQGKMASVWLHREVAGFPFPDHINGNGLDCRRANIRKATNAQNQANRAKNRYNTSGYKGVSWYSLTNRWRSQIEVNGHNRHIGYHLTLEEGARAYDEAARKAFGEFACVNFPKPGEHGH